MPGQNLQPQQIFCSSEKAFPKSPGCDHPSDWSWGFDGLAAGGERAAIQAQHAIAAEEFLQAVSEKENHSTWCENLLSRRAMMASALEWWSWGVHGPRPSPAACQVVRDTLSKTQAKTFANYQAADHLRVKIFYPISSHARWDWSRGRRQTNELMCIPSIRRLLHQIIPCDVVKHHPK